MSRRKLYRHQQEAEAKALRLDGRCGIFMSVGTGKTRVAIELAERLVRRVVVVAPLTAFGVWREQVREWAPEARTVTCADRSVTKRAQRVRRLCKTPTDRLVFVIVGYESYWRRPLRQALLRYRPEMVIYDEAHRLANRGTSQSRFAHTLASSDNKIHTPQYLLPLTGTPSPNGPHDVFSIFKAFDPTVFGMSWQAFAARYIKNGGYYGHCQPGDSQVLIGTRQPHKRGGPVTLVSTTLGEVRPRDQIVTYDSQKRFFRLLGTSVSAVKRAWYSGDLVEVLSQENKTRYTPEHKCFVSLRHLEGKYAVYLLRRGSQYRVGSSRIWRTGGSVGPLGRMRAERADAVWIVSLHDNAEDAFATEHLISARYGLPEICFRSAGPNRRKLFDRVWKALGSNSDRGEACLFDHDRHPSFPLAERGARWRYRRQFITAAYNLMDGMALLKFSGQHRTTDDWKSINVRRVPFTGHVYSLKVPGGLFVSDGFVTHNSIVGYRNQKELRRKVAEHSYRITKAEALDLPEEVDVVIPVTLSGETRRVYDDLAEKALAEVEGEQGRGVAVGRIVLTNQIRLQQVASGFVKVEDGRLLDFGREKRDALAELLADILPDVLRAVIFCRWTHDVEVAMRVAAKVVGEREVFRFDGKVNKQRDILMQQRGFRNAQRSVMVVQVQKAVSIDLTAAHVGIFYSKDWSLLNFEQCRGRLHRHGQTQKVTYYHLIARKTIDRKVQRALAHKEDLSHRTWDKHRAREFFS